MSFIEIIISTDTTIQLHLHNCPAHNYCIYNYSYVHNDCLHNHFIRKYPPPSLSSSGSANGGLYRYQVNSYPDWPIPRSIRTREVHLYPQWRSQLESSHLVTSWLTPYKGRVQLVPGASFIKPNYAIKNKYKIV